MDRSIDPIVLFITSYHITASPQHLHQSVRSGTGLCGFSGFEMYTTYTTGTYANFKGAPLDEQIRPSQHRWKSFLHHDQDIC